MTRDPTFEGLQQKIAELEKELERCKPNEAELVKRQKYLESVLHHAPDAIVTLDSSHRILEWNPGAAKIFGYTKEEAIGRNLDHLVTRPDVMDDAQANTRSVLSGQPLQPEETIRYTKSGNPVQVIASGAPIIIDGRVQGVVAVYTDISEPKRVAKALEESERTYRAIFENTGTATIIVEEDTTISLANREFERLTGFCKEEIQGRKSWREFIATQQDLDRMDRYHRLRRVDPQAAPNTYECLIKDKTGEPKNILITIDMIPVTKQSVASFLNLSDYKTLQEDLKQERDYLNNILENSADAIAILDKQGTFIRWNKRAAELFGYTYEEIKQRKVFDFHSDQAQMDKMLHLLRQQGYVRDYEISFQRKGGPDVPCSVSVTLLKDSSNRNIGSVSIVRDLSEWKETEQQLIYLCYHDTLCGLYNRNFFEKEMNRLSDGRYAPVGIIICDLDGLKFVNDTKGHKSGDQLLCQAADILRTTFRSSDIVARIGGDEFAVLVTGADQATTKGLVTRLKENVDDFNAHDRHIPLYMSIGYAVSQSQPIDMEGLFREADNRMYEEKIRQKRSTRGSMTADLNREK
ncbi:MAG: PAS domain S-box protein [Desulfovermiculus sp.]|nr:PAS domain S-box protein [Desulfovermiculus sp.]